MQRLLIPHIITQWSNACLLTSLTSSDFFDFSTGYLFGDYKHPGLSESVTALLFLFPIRSKIVCVLCVFSLGIKSMLCFLNAEHHPQREQFGFLNAKAD